MTRLSVLVSVALMAGGGVAALQTLSRRRLPRAQSRTVSIVVELADVVAVSVRAGLPLAELLPRLHASGATRCTLPERTLKGLLDSGQLFQSVPRAPNAQPAPFGRWVYLTSADAELVQDISAELQARLPHIRAGVLPGDAHTLSFAGDLEVMGAIGLGFDAALAGAIHAGGLGVVPRPVSYDWHEPALIERTLAQAAALGDGVVAFEGSLILGHEMHLAETLSALEAHAQTFAYFAESRHQRGDWFIAKRRMPNVIIAHQYTPAQMIPEDFHSIAHHWANLARERGVRMMFANFFRVVHATEPLECLKYLEHIRGAVEGQGLVLESPALRLRVPFVPSETAAEFPHLPDLTALVPVGAGTLALSALLGLNDLQSLAMSGAGVLGSLALTGRLDRAHDALEQQYAPAYASKLISLAAAALAPLAAVALANTSENALEALMLDGVIGASTAAAISALTSSDEYRLRVEEYKGFDLDLWLPLAGALISFTLPMFSRPNSTASTVESDPVAPLLGRVALGAALSIAGWYATRRLASDPFARFDLAPAMSHTHHLSAAMRRVGDTMLALGPRPIRKWSGLAPFGLALAIAARQAGLRPLALAGTLLSVAGHAAANTGFRRPERDLLVTARAVTSSWLLGSLAGLLAANLIRALKSEG